MTPNPSTKPSTLFMGQMTINASSLFSDFGLPYIYIPPKTMRESMVTFNNGISFEKMPYAIYNDGQCAGLNGNIPHSCAIWTLGPHLLVLFREV